MIFHSHVVQVTIVPVFKINLHNSIPEVIYFSCCYPIYYINLYYLICCNIFNYAMLYIIFYIYHLILYCSVPLYTYYRNVLYYVGPTITITITTLCYIMVFYNILYYYTYYLYNNMIHPDTMV